MLRSSVPPDMLYFVAASSGMIMVGTGKLCAELLSKSDDYPAAPRRRNVSLPPKASMFDDVHTS